MTTHRRLKLGQIFDNLDRLCFEKRKHFLWSIREAARDANMPHSTYARIEAGLDVNATTFKKALLWLYQDKRVTLPSPKPYFDAERMRS